MTGSAARRRETALLCVLALLLGLLQPLSARAEEKTLRVGWYQVEGVMSEDDAGGRSGYCYDFMQEIALFTDYDYVYVSGTWQECLDRLRDGEIDVLPYVQYSEARDAYMDFTENQLGQSYSTLTRLASRTDIQAGDYATYEGRRVGVIAGSTQMEQLRTFMDEKGLTCETLLYEDMAGLLAALYDGQIDMLLHTSFRKLTEGEVVLDKFAPHRFFLAVGEGDQALRSALDQALDRIRIFDETFAERTQNKYFALNTPGSLILSPEDHQLLEEMGELHVIVPREEGYVLHENGGVTQGVYHALAQTMADRLSLSLRYEELDESDIPDAASSGGITLVAGQLFDFALAEEQGCHLTTPYSTTAFYRVEVTGHAPTNSLTALPRGLSYLTGEHYLDLPDSSVLWCDSTEACLDAVLTGAAGSACGEAASMDYLLGSYRYRTLSASLLPLHANLCFGVWGEREHEVSLLCSRVIANIGQSAISDIFIQNRPILMERTSLAQLISDQPALFALAVFSFAMSIVLVLLLLRRSRDRRRQADYQKLLRTKARLEASQSSMEAAVEGAGMMYFEYYPEEHCALEYNGRERFGVEQRMEDYPESWFRRGITLPEDEPILRAAFAAMDRGEERADCEVRNLVAGKVMWHRYTFTTIRDAAGKRVKVVCTAMDVTLQKAADQQYRQQLDALRQSDPRLLASFRLNLTGNQCGMGLGKSERLPALEIDGTVDGLVQRTAALSEDPAGQARFLALFGRERLAEAFRQDRREIAHVARIRLPDGSERFLRCTVRMFENPATGDTEGVLLLTDVDQEVREQMIAQHLVRVEYDFVATIDVATGRLGRTDHSAGGTIYAEDYAEDLQAFITQAVYPEDQARCARELILPALTAQLDRDDMFIIAFRQTEAGEIRYKQQRYAYLNPERDIILLCKRDVTADTLADRDRVAQLERALDRAEEASNAKTDFLSNMSHEIRTPMNAIIGMTKLAQEEAAEMPAIADYLKQIDDASGYLLGVINDILDMSRIESGKFQLNCEWAYPHAVTLTCIRMMQPVMAQKGITFVYPDSITRQGRFQMYVDVLKTRQMLMNLLNNAYKFTPAGGRIELKLRNLALDSDHATDEIIISDTGCGMSREFLSRIFNPFEQERNVYTGAVQGTGLGLALARRIAREMGGDITVESELGKGSTFTVRIVYAYRAATEDDAPADAPLPLRSGGLKGKRILLAEDHPVNAAIAAKLLEKQEAVVTRAENGQVALTLFRDSPPHTFDAILMDVRMPVMDGLAATRAIRALPRADATLPIIAMTANAFDEDKRQTREAGMTAHLAKPVDPDLLIKTLEDLIAGGTGQEG